MQDKLKYIIQNWPNSLVATTSWLEKSGIYKQLRSKYQKNHWIESVGYGAFIKNGDKIDWKNGVCSIQNQTDTIMHVGALTALELENLSHYVRVDKSAIYLFTDTKSTIPSWFVRYKWEQEIKIYHTDCFPSNIGLKNYQDNNLEMKISAPERAFLECIYLSPKIMDLVECYYILEGLANLRPDLLQSLLEGCKSIKVKRLFLYMAEKAGHKWFKYIGQTKIDSGSGERSIVKNGIYIPKYKITVPKELNEL